MEGRTAVARTIPMPSKEELPDGPRRAFVTELRRYYRVARPSLREISQAIERHPDPRLDKVTASAETVRRMITGKVLPERERLYAVFRVLCDMAEVDPDAEHWDDDGRYNNYSDPESHWQYLRQLWDNALEDESDAPPLPRPTPTPPEPKPARPTANDDPWNNGSSYSDEPPF
jgi:hypothetical protein